MPRCSTKDMPALIECVTGVTATVREGADRAGTPVAATSRRSRPRARHCRGPHRLPSRSTTWRRSRRAAVPTRSRSIWRSCAATTTRAASYFARPCTRAARTRSRAAAATTRSARPSAAPGRPTGSRSTCANWSVCCQRPRPNAILAPAGEAAELREAIAALRAAGQIVVQRLPDEVADAEPGDFVFDRELRYVDSGWRAIARGGTSS